MIEHQPSAAALAALLARHTGQQLVTGRMWRIETSLKPIMRANGFASIEALAASLAAGREPALAAEVVEALLNNETYFFRDAAMYNLLRSPAIERLREARSRLRTLDIWCAGCSTGQEAYSLALTLAEDSLRWHDWRVRIIGTDVSGSAIRRAGAGIYSQFEIQRGLPVTMMMRWFEQHGDSWTAKPDLRRKILFQQHNLIADAPPQGKFDIVLCRNVMLYFPADIRVRAFDRLASAMRSDAVLMLGASETVIGQTSRFRADSAHPGHYFLAPDHAAISHAA